MEEPIIKISVRNLVEFILRTGDIDNRTSGSLEKDAMLQGSRLHRKIQRRMGADYHAEVALKTKVVCTDFLLLIEGRADGIIENDSGICIDEIKGTIRDLSHIEEPIGVHLAQAKCYAYIYATQQHLTNIDVQMTYCHLETEEIKRFKQNFLFDDLEKWFNELIHAYEKWAKFQIQWKKERDRTIQKTEFPFSYREGQREVVSSVYRTILRKKNLFIQAPTGIGKTMATIFPAVRAIGEGLGEKIFYLTAKTITKTVAEQAFYILRKNGLRWKSVTVTAKEKICFCEETICNPDECPYAKGHFDRVNDAVFELISTKDECTREIIEEQARKYHVCPFEMSLDVSEWMDAIICDYNYVFDPDAHLKRFFSEGGTGEYLFLIDEAHNLVERGREMYSATLYKEDFLSMKKLFQSDAPKLAKRLDECNKQLLALKRECETYQVIDNVSHIALKCLNILGEIENYFDEQPSPEKKDALLDFYFQIRSFINIHDILDENYLIYTEMESDGRFKLKLFCVNPATNLQRFLEYGNSTIYFSATFLPVFYYKNLLSVNSDDYAIYAKSTFPEENKLLLLAEDVSTKYTLRGPEMYQKIARYIQNIVSVQQGNYMVFFPSYRMLEEVYEQFVNLPTSLINNSVECILQSQYMNEIEREEFLNCFESQNDRTLIGFCVMGGIFSEGIDLAEDRLIGAIIVGTGLPQVCNERELLKQYFDAKKMSGFDFAYLYPGMNKVLQSAGRVIRTESDKGVIVLLDVRFLDNRYQAIFPREWKQYQLCQLNHATDIIAAFWQDKNKERI